MLVFKKLFAFLKACCSIIGLERIFSGKKQCTRKKFNNIATLSQVESSLTWADWMCRCSFEGLQNLAEQWLHKKSFLSSWALRWRRNDECSEKTCSQYWHSNFPSFSCTVATCLKRREEDFDWNRQWGHLNFPEDGLLCSTDMWRSSSQALANFKVQVWQLWTGSGCGLLILFACFLWTFSTWVSSLVLWQKVR
jgi:hypothetical protein